MFKDHKSSILMIRRLSFILFADWKIFFTALGLRQFDGKKIFVNVYSQCIHTSKVYYFYKSAVFYCCDPQPQKYYLVRVFRFVFIVHLFPLF